MSERVVDTHVHWRNPAINPYELLSDGVDENGARGGSAPQAYLPNDYLNDMRGFQLEGVVHVEAEWLKTASVGETRWLEGLADNDELDAIPLAIIGFCDLSLPTADAVLAQHAQHPRVRGIRHILNHLPENLALCWADRDYLSDESWRRNFGLLSTHGLDFDLMCFAHQLPAVAELAQRHPNTAIHLEHAALPHDHSSSGFEAWRHGMRTLAARPNADVKISGLGNTIPDWTIEKIRPYVLESIEIFGTERVSFASNAPTDKQFSSVATVWEAFFEITQHMTAAEREQVFVGNARRIYRL